MANDVKLCGSCGAPLPHTHESEWRDTVPPKPKGK